LSELGGSDVVACLFLRNSGPSLLHSHLCLPALVHLFLCPSPLPPPFSDTPFLPWVLSLLGSRTSSAFFLPPSFLPLVPPVFLVFWPTSLGDRHKFSLVPGNVSDYWSGEELNVAGSSARFASRPAREGGSFGPCGAPPGPDTQPTIISLFCDARKSLPLNAFLLHSSQLGVGFYLVRSGSFSCLPPSPVCLGGFLPCVFSFLSSFLVHLFFSLLLPYCFLPPPLVRPSCASSVLSAPPVAGSRQGSSPSFHFN